jgi:hypothetical protein
MQSINMSYVSVHNSEICYARVGAEKMLTKMKATSFPFSETQTTGVGGCM